MKDLSKCSYSGFFSSIPLYRSCQCPEIPHLDPVAQGTRQENVVIAHVACTEQRLVGQTLFLHLDNFVNRPRVGVLDGAADGLSVEVNDSEAPVGTGANDQVGVELVGRGEGGDLLASGQGKCFPLPEPKLLLISVIKTDLKNETMMKRRNYLRVG